MSDYPSVNDLTLEEKAALTSGTNPWSLGNVAAKGRPEELLASEEVRKAYLGI